MREGPTWMAIACAAARATASVHAEPHSSITLITGYNLFQGNLNLPLEEIFNVLAFKHICGHQFNVMKPQFQLARWQVAFEIRVVGLWNRLPPSVAEAPSLHAFKERLDSCRATIYPILS